MVTREFWISDFGFQIYGRPTAVVTRRNERVAAHPPRCRAVDHGFENPGSLRSFRSKVATVSAPAAFATSRMR